MTENSSAWDKFFNQTATLAEIEGRGYSYVTADSLKRITGREPRLLAKLDTLHDCPDIFKTHGLTIFPVKNGEYVIFKDPQRKTYFRLDEHQYPDPLEEYISGVDLNSFDAFPGIQRLNESQALDFAFVSSLLRKFTGDPGLNLVIRGRLFSGAFDFRLPETDHSVRVNGVQIEVDGGYESRDAIYLIEVKTGKRADFHIRQLYYPYLEWSARSRKHIIPILLIFTNGKFYFFQFRFNRDFGDLKIERASGFVVNEVPIARLSISQLTNRTAVEPEPSVPFPQANDLDKIVDLVSLVDRSNVTKPEVAEHFDFDERQGDYYANAAIYLGFLTRANDGFTVTDLGQRFIGMKSLATRTEIMVEQMLKRPVFRSVFGLWKQYDLELDRVSPAEISALIEEHTPLSGSTPPRRASTVMRWLQWVQQNTIIEA